MGVGGWLTTSKVMKIGWVGLGRFGVYKHRTNDDARKQEINGSHQSSMLSGIFLCLDISMSMYMAGVQNSWSKGLYKVGPIGIEKLILHLRYEAGPIGNDAVHKLGASIALAWR